jgi:hypothetical protein
MPRSESGHGSSAFMTMFGGSLGCFAAIVLVCGGLLFLAIQAGNRDPAVNPAPGTSR